MKGDEAIHSKFHKKSCLSSTVNQKFVVVTTVALKRNFLFSKGFQPQVSMTKEIHVQV